MLGARGIKDLDCTQLTGIFAEMYFLDSLRKIQDDQHSQKADREVRK